MNNKEFVVKLGTYYREPLLLEGKPNIRLITLEKWITASGITPEQLSVMFDKIILNFIPTSINPMPLVPHIIQICELQTTEKSKLELARTIADRIINAVLTIGCREQGSKDKAYNYIGDLGIKVVKSIYGSWYSCCQIDNESVEVMRSHIRDSAVAIINRMEKGIEELPPALTDLKKRIGEPERLKITEKRD